MALYIGIDPGVHTGIAVWDTETRKFRLIETRTIIGALQITDLWEAGDEDLHIVFEDARQRKWIPREKDLSQFKGRAMGAGSICRDCEIWETYCKVKQFKYTAVPPRKGLTKWTAESFARVTGWKGRTSNHARDAAMLVFGK